jgi:uncharacterized membrane protein (Fun14 family)
MELSSSIAVTIGGGFFGGLLLGYAVKKAVKLIAVIVGLFIAGLAYLQYQQIASFNWDKIEGTISTIANATTNTFNGYNIENTSNDKLRDSSCQWCVCWICNWLHEGIIKVG